MFHRRRGKQQKHLYHLAQRITGTKADPESWPCRLDRVQEHGILQNQKLLTGYTFSNSFIIHEMEIRKRHGNLKKTNSAELCELPDPSELRKPC